MTCRALRLVTALTLTGGLLLLGGCKLDRMRTDFVAIRYMQDAERRLTRLPRDAAGARHALNRAVALMPPKNELRLRVARLYVAARDYASARALFEAIPESELSPDDRALLGYCLMKTGERERGARLCLRVIEDVQAMRKSGVIGRSQWALLLNDAGYLLVDAGEELETATDAVRVAMEAMPLQAAFIDSYGWALARQNRLHDAAFYLERACRLNAREDPELLYHLGVVYARLQRFSDAEQMLRRAYHLDPDLSAAQEELRHLGRILPPPVLA